MPLAGFDLHTHAILRPQGDQGLGNDSVVRNKPQAPALGQGSEQQDSFHPGEGFPDTHSRSATKREVRELVPGLARFRGPTRRLEFERIRKIARIMVHHVGTH